MKRRNKSLTAGLLAIGIFLSGFTGGYIVRKSALYKQSLATQATEQNNDPIIEEEEPSSVLPFLEETFPDVFKPDETIQNEQVEQTPEETIMEEIIPEEKVEVSQNEIMYATTNLNLRTSPSTDGLIISSLEIYDKVEQLAKGQNWSLVKFNDQLAFANNNYLQPTNTKEEATVEHELKNDIVLTTTKLNFRRQPSAESDRILTFEENTELQVLAETDNGWLLVKSNNVLGYVKKDYTISLLEMLNNIYPNLLDELSLEKVVYATEGLNIRSGNSTETEVVDRLEKLESVRVFGEYDDWYLIMTNDHTFGFVNKNYTKELTEEFVIVDLSKQTLYLYNGKDQYIQTPITSGKDSTPSDKGLFKIYYKSLNTPLIGDDYNVTVDYWMNYNNGEGLHDASWRSVFGTESYHTNGSHGCINIPPNLADDVYEYTKVGTKVLVHK